MPEPESGISSPHAANLTELLGQSNQPVWLQVFRIQFMQAVLQSLNHDATVVGVNGLVHLATLSFNGLR